MTYTPAPGFYGSDSFAFKVNDGVMDSRIATVSITVNAPPTVTLDPAGPVDEGAPAIGLTAHASDPDGDPVSLTWSTPDGTASFAADDGPATATVTVTADDGRGGVAKASTDIEVRNVPPTADAGPDACRRLGHSCDAQRLGDRSQRGRPRGGTDGDVGLRRRHDRERLRDHHVYADPARTRRR